MLTFKEEGHKYTSIPGTKNIEWISATKIISMYHDHFPTKKASENCSKSKGSKYYGFTAEEIREIWKEENLRSTNEGSLYHDREERKILSHDFMKRNGKMLKVNKPVIRDGHKYAPSQILSDGWYPEHFVYFEEYGVCGQADLIVCQDGEIHELDYKTNKKLVFEEIDYDTGLPKMMKGCLSHIYDCNFSHYEIQLSIYMYIMLHHNPDMVKGKMAIKKVAFKKIGENEFGYPIHAYGTDGVPLIDEDQTKIIHVRYMEDEVKEIFKDLKNKRK